MEEQELYDKYEEGRHWENHPTVYAERFADFLKKEHFEGLLVDAGCGNGRDVEVFHSKGFDVLGIDNFPKEIDLAYSLHDKCNFKVGDVEKLSFDDSTVSAYFMINVIHYVKKKKALNEIFRTLKKGGYLFIHFNTSITDSEGNLDYQDPEVKILNLVKDFKILHKKVFERVDSVPKEHTHKIIELILQK